MKKRKQKEPSILQKSLKKFENSKRTIRPSGTYSKNRVEYAKEIIQTYFLENKTRQPRKSAREIRVVTVNGKRVNITNKEAEKAIEIITGRIYAIKTILKIDKIIKRLDRESEAELKKEAKSLIKFITTLSSGT